MGKGIKSNSKKIRERFRKKMDENRPFVVVPDKRGRPRFYDAEKYYGQKALMKDLIQVYKPWTKRQKSLLGPIGTKSLGVKGKLTRVDIYNEEE